MFSYLYQGFFVARKIMDIGIGQKCNIGASCVCVCDIFVFNLSSQGPQNVGTHYGGHEP
jgi:hypothetical protein